MESFDSSPNYMRATSSFDAKKEYSSGGSECDDMISATYSTCGSSVNGPYTPKLNNNGTKHKTTKNKPIKNFRSVKSFRRRAKSRIVHHSPVTISDEDSLVDSSESSPNYLKATSCSQGKKTPFSESPNDKNSSKSKSASLGTSSLKNVRRVLLKKTSFKPKRGLSSYSKVLDDVAVTRATYSSTLRDSKFPEAVELRPRGVESEKNSSVKVCRYHHCSLHGHCRGAHGDPVSQPKRSLYKKRRSLKKQKSVIPTMGPGGKKRNCDEKNDFRKSEIIPIVEQLNQDNKLFGDGYENNIRELDFLEVAFGETSFPERAHKENLEISSKYSLYEQYGYCTRCSCHNGEQVTTSPRRADGDSSSREVVFSIPQKPNEEAGNYISDEKSNNKDCPETPVIYDELTGKNRRFASSSTSRTSSDVNSEEDRDSTPAGDFMVNNETNSPAQESGKLQLSKPRHISMWNLIHQHMSTSLAAEPTNKLLEGAESEIPVVGENSFVAKESMLSGRDLSDPETGSMSNDSENREIELRKMFAIKLVREAIEKILLPEVQDQSSDDQSVTKSKAADKDESNVSSNPIQESLISDTEIKKDEKVIAKKSEKKAPKHWSNLKKWFLLQRFIRELEKVKKLNPKKPHLLPLNPGPEAEKVNLRPLTVDGKKNTEEWMLDYALRQAVGQLAPTQKRKVALLVKAFETVAPTKEDDPQSQSRIPRLKSDESVFKGDTPNSQDVQENVKFNPVEEKTEESGACVQKDHIKMWHMIYQHVVSNIAEKVGNQLLDGDEDDEAEEDNTSLSNNETSEKNHASNNMDSGFTKSDALKLVKEAVDEILVPESQDAKEETQIGEKAEELKPKNWSKLKRLILLKRSIRALEKARKLKAKEHRLVPEMSDREPEKIDLRSQMMDERKKAEQWMVDYAVQHIVTKLTPARKRRVLMLVEAFEAVVPLPEM
ncbi:hypothetical protein PHJA_000231200 [Phtheirospermum japonicum]|uniref:Calmodulin-binding domain-containing protein n=1 Tax=Phtheirospermum japonicum TaxID=374723 RepID=A0A830B6H2_9LAMI|nr:hypothetical protein PHJA_000231200 [Phtheirospermum japonicum]